MSDVFSVVHHHHQHYPHYPLPVWSSQVTGPAGAMWTTENTMKPSHKLLFVLCPMLVLGFIYYSSGKLHLHVWGQKPRKLPQLLLFCYGLFFFFVLLESKGGCCNLFRIVFFYFNFLIVPFDYFLKTLLIIGIHNQAFLSETATVLFVGSLGSRLILIWQCCIQHTLVNTHNTQNLLGVVCLCLCGVVGGVLA